MPFLTTPHGALHWLDTASDPDAPAVVLIHGLGGDASFWAAEQAALAAHFRVLTVDLRGSGLSARTSGAFAIEDLARDVVAILDHAGITHAHVVGFSMGGVVAQALASHAPGRVDRLVLAATFARTNPQAVLFLQAVGTVYRRGATPRQVFDLVLPWLFSEAFFSDPRAAPYLDYPEEAADEQTPQDWQRLLDAMCAFDGHARLATLACPTLVMAGDEDRLATLADAQHLASGIPGAVLHVLRGGHLMNVESPEAFIEHVMQFLRAPR
ncbi:alpha/beta fold hydrolase [Stenotrophomonas sp.]|uniref:alpha/beta fold hydrolase n=1 Tax=Stenotrophomonas sp. TaxID=69392 RepID=UPI002FC7A185